MTDFEAVWERIKRNAGQEFTTKTGHAFTYRVPGDYMRVTVMAVRSTAPCRRQTSGAPPRRCQWMDQVRSRIVKVPSYTWAILMDRRIRVDRLVTRTVGTSLSL